MRGIARGFSTQRGRRSSPTRQGVAWLDPRPHDGRAATGCEAVRRDFKRLDEQAGLRRQPPSPKPSWSSRNAGICGTPTALTVYGCATSTRRSRPGASSAARRGSLLTAIASPVPSSLSSSASGWSSSTSCSSDDGALYLHLDTNKAHYMKVLLDEVFGPQNFRSEIIWKRSTAHSDTKQGRAQHGRIHDSILFFTKSDQWVWNPIHTPYDEHYVTQRFVHEDPNGRRYKDADLTGAKPGGDTSFLWHIKAPAGTTDWVGDPEGEWKKPKTRWTYKAIPPSQGRYWAYSYDNFLSFHADKPDPLLLDGHAGLKQYADELEGVSLQDLWTDIFPIEVRKRWSGSVPDAEAWRYLNAIIRSATNAGDLVLDCFAGAGTTAGRRRAA